MTGLSDLALRILISAENKAGPALKETAQAVGGIEQKLQNLQTVAKRFLEFRLFQGFAAEALKTADAYQTISARLRLVSDSQQEFNRAQRELFDIAQRSRAPLEATVDVYGKIETAVKTLGGTQDEALSITETLNKAIALTSQGAAQDAAAILQFGQALGSASLQGDELRSILENSPGLAKALADGLGVPVTKLKELGAAGLLSGDQLVTALVKSKASVDQAFGSLPLTIGQAIQQVQNAWTRFIGEANQAAGVTRTIAATISGAATYFHELAGAIVVLGGAYAAHLVANGIKAAQASLQQVAAARLAAAARTAEQTALLAATAAKIRETEAEIAHTTAQIAGLRARYSTIEATRLESALLTQLAAQKAALAGAQAAQAAAMANLGSASVTLGSQLRSLNGILNLLQAGFVGWEIGTWLRNFEWARLAGVALAKTFHQLATIIAHVLTGEFLGSGPTLAEKLKALEDEYASIAEDSTDAAEAQIQNEQAAAKATEEAQKVRQQAFKQTQEDLKNVTAQLSAEYSQQNALIETALKARTLAIEKSKASERQKEQQTTQAVNEALKQRLTALDRYATERLRLIDATFAQEASKEKLSAIEKATIEKASIEARKDTYNDLAKSYTQAIDSILAQQQREVQAANQTAQQIIDVQRSAAEAIKAVRQAGLSGQELKQAKEAELTSNLTAFRNEAAKGATANEKELQRLYGENLAALKEKYTTEAAEAATGVDRRIAQFEGQRRINDLTQQYTQALGGIAAQHKANADALNPSLDAASAKFADITAKVRELDASLAQNKTLAIQADTASVEAFQKTIAELTAPATKTITVQTVQKTAGEPVATLATGGFARRQGRLSGYGGGDRIKALLEAGEFVVRKEAVSHYGAGLFAQLNAIALPGFARGGAVAEAIDRVRWDAFARFAEGGAVPSAPKPSSPSALQPVNLYLPGGTSYPLSGAPDVVSALTQAVAKAALKHGRNRP
jgi:tape measure domain-containing protein